MDEDELDRLAQLAREGDRMAASQLLVEVMPRLAVISRREAKGLLEPEDLQAHAVEKLLGLWAEGEGPANGVVGYLVRTMHNRVIDEARSPRSQTRNLHETEDFASDEDPSKLVEFDREKRWVQGALKRLVPDQRRVMIGIYAEDLKPADLAEELGKSPNAVYSLHRRSKIALRRATLQEALVEGAPPVCRDAAEQLPDVIEEDIEETRNGGAAGMAHITGCDRCRAAWSRFGSITSALGIGGLLALTVNSSTPAVALTSDSTALSYGAKDSAGKPGPIEKSSGDASGEPRPRWRWAATGASLGLLAGAIGGLAICRYADPVTPPVPSGALTMSVENRGDVRVTVGFSIDSDSWEQEQFELAFPESLSLKYTPDGWDCDESTSSVRCEDTGDRPLHGTFVFDGDGSLGDELRVSLRATSESNEFRGYASSEVPRPGDAITTRADVLAGDK
ncbi:sigma-70 family RNA polymerase sigma factor [Leucobacter tenebrionis]|uniref:sigma-70 family RNA polymerase sigma factor n=1 Tax=Leucobacter tenebrionis TaxID=2873270 RepID=UPI001CA68B9B|nr:sigma-70 family RNA polymerase sigma factor [Leucobacter tenebrionis]QZY52245.1 sigma-70 family RNA polymerase sigma factor [Leucobacter tenebrionis]